MRAVGLGGLIALIVVPAFIARAEGPVQSTLCSASPYPTSTGNPLGSVSTKTASSAEELAKQEIQKFQFFQEKENELKKIEIVLDSNSTTPYQDAQKKYANEMKQVRLESHAIKTIRETNKNAETLGRKKIVVADSSSATPFADAVDANKDYVNELQYDISYFPHVKNALEELKAEGIEHKLRLDPTERAPQTRLFGRLMRHHPNLKAFDSFYPMRTVEDITCAPRLGGNHLRDFQDLRKSCEATDNLGLKLEDVLASINQALRLSEAAETDAEIIAREKEATKIIEDSGFFGAFAGVSKSRRNPGFRDCGLSDAELAVISAYTGSLYSLINMTLRAGANQNRALIDTLNSGLAKLGNNRGIVNRGVNDLGSDLDELKVGSVKHFKAFLSTSRSAGFLNKHRFKIQTCSGKYIAPLSGLPGEEEVLIKSGSNFKVTGREPLGEGFSFTLEEICEE